jgi:outer membrane protein W
MKKHLKGVALVALTLIGLSATQASAQIQLGFSGNHYSSTENGAKFSDGLWGGGVTVRYFVQPKVALGLNARYFTRSESGISATFIPVTAQLDYFFTEGTVRPYVGLEGGAYVSRAKIDFAGYQQSASKTYLGAAPKVGLQFMFSQTVGLDVNAGYHLVFVPKGEGGTSKDLMLGAGLVFNLGGK